MMDSLLKSPLSHSDDKLWYIKTESLEKLLQPLDLPRDIKEEFLAKVIVHCILKKAYLATSPWSKWILIAALEELLGRPAPLLDENQVKLIQNKENFSSEEVEMSKMNMEDFYDSFKELDLPTAAQTHCQSSPMTKDGKCAERVGLMYTENGPLYVDDSSCFDSKKPLLHTSNSNKPSVLSSDSKKVISNSNSLGSNAKMDSCHRTKPDLKISDSINSNINNSHDDRPSINSSHDDRPDFRSSHVDCREINSSHDDRPDFKSFHDDLPKMNTSHEDRPDFKSCLCIQKIQTSDVYVQCTPQIMGLVSHKEQQTADVDQLTTLKIEAYTQTNFSTVVPAVKEKLTLDFSSQVDLTTDCDKKKRKGKKWCLTRVSGIRHHKRLSTSEKCTKINKGGGSIKMFYGRPLITGKSELAPPRIPLRPLIMLSEFYGLSDPRCGNDSSFTNCCNTSSEDEHNYLYNKEPNLAATAYDSDSEVVDITSEDGGNTACRNGSTSGSERVEQLPLSSPIASEKDFLTSDNCDIVDMEIGP